MDESWHRRVVRPTHNGPRTPFAGLVRAERPRPLVYRLVQRLSNRIAAIDRAAAGTLAAVPLKGVRFVRPLGILHRRAPKPSPTAQRFIELLRQPDDPISEDQPVSGLFAAGNKSTPPHLKSNGKLASRGNGK